jgi:enoyl-CoA hydratase/carnithine racemase
MEPVLLRHRHGAVEVVTLNRPERRNALSSELLGALDAAFDELARDHEVRAVVITGAGDRAFCAGLDLKDFASDRTGSPIAKSDAQPAATGRTVRG